MPFAKAGLPLSTLWEQWGHANSVLGTLALATWGWARRSCIPFWSNPILASMAVLELPTKEANLLLSGVGWPYSLPPASTAAGASLGAIVAGEAAEVDVDEDADAVGVVGWSGPTAAW